MTQTQWRRVEGAIVVEGEGGRAVSYDGHVVLFHSRAQRTGYHQSTSPCRALDRWTCWTDTATPREIRRVAEASMESEQAAFTVLQQIWEEEFADW